eukprot:1086500-Rhodomonas_salina.1
MNDAVMRPGVCELCDQLRRSDEIKSSGRQDKYSSKAECKNTHALCLACLYDTLQQAKNAALLAKQMQS